MIASKTVQPFKIEGISQKLGEFKELFSCRATKDANMNKKQDFNSVLDCTLKSSFINPIIEYSTNPVKLKYI